MAQLSSTSPTIEDSQQHPADEFLLFSLLLYSIIFLVGTLGNLMFTYIVISSASSSLKTVTNYLLVNLSVTDIMIAWLCIPVQITILWIHWFPFGAAICYLVSFLQPVAIFTSSFTLVIICIERYLSILHPLRRRLQNSKLLISTTWLLGCLVSVPDALLVQYEIPPGDKHPQCYKETRGMKGSLEMVYDMFVLTVQYVAPVLVMGYSYGMIALTIWRKTESGLVQSSQSTIRKNQMIKSKQKVIKMLIVIVTVYTICYFPINIGWLLLGSLASLPPATVGYIHTVFLWLALSHTCCNPVIYLGMNQKVRVRFLHIISSAPFMRKCTNRPQRTPEHEQTSLTCRRNTIVCLPSAYQGRQTRLHSSQITEVTLMQTDVSSVEMEHS